MLRVTVFADHDLKHSLAGGANVNLQENLRLLAGKVRIRLLTSWQAGLAEEETVDGIEIRRFKGNALTLRWTIPRFYKRHLERETDLVWDEVDSSVPWLTPLFASKPILMHCLHFQKSNFFHELPAWMAAIAYVLEPLLYKLYRGHAALTISQSTADDLLAIGFRRETMSVVHPGLDPSVFAPPAEVLARKSEQPLIVSLSRLRAWKGVHYAIQAMPAILAKVPAAQLAVIGTGPYENDLRGLARRLNLEARVKFLGRLSEQEKLSWLKRAHVLTKTSGREGWGIDVLEANACMTPAVGWNVPGTRDSIRDGRTGTLVPFPDTVRLADEVSRLLMDPGLRSRMAGEAYAYAQGFTWPKSASQIEAILTKVAGRIS